MAVMELVTLEEWRKAHPERWARIEGTLTRNEYRTLKFLDAQIHLTREANDSVRPPDTPEVRWLRSCIAIYLFVCAHGYFPKDERSVTWVKNQRRGALCDYQVASLMQIPGWQWALRKTSWDERAADLDDFRREYGRDPRVRSGWEHERALAHWQARQRAAARAGKLSPRQVGQLEGQTGIATGELIFRVPTFVGASDGWFEEFWSKITAVNAK